MYKLTEGSILKDGMSIPQAEGNRHYQEFISDVKEHGLSIVEGPDVVEPDYTSLRAGEYPTMSEQLDMQYWDNINGTTTWQDTIDAIKAKYPKTITGGTTVGAIPDWVKALVEE